MPTDQKVIRGRRSQRVWRCSECQKEYPQIPAQCVCSAMAQSFVEDSSIIGENDTGVQYLFKSSVIYDGRHINPGTIMNLVEDDRVTKDLLNRGLIKPVKAKK